MHRPGVKNPKTEHSIANPFHILQQNLLAAAVIELCGAAVGMAGDSLGGFKGSLVAARIRTRNGTTQHAFLCTEMLKITA